MVMARATDHACYEIRQGRMTHKRGKRINY